MISFHTRPWFPSTDWKVRRSRNLRLNPIQCQPGRDGLLNTSNPLPPPAPSPRRSPSKPSPRPTLSVHHLQWPLRNSSENPISSSGPSPHPPAIPLTPSLSFARDDNFTRLISPTNTTSWSPIIPPLNLAPWNLPDLTTNIKEIDFQRESRIKELELELAAWKQANASLLESVERERKAHNVQIASFNRHFASLDFFKVRACHPSRHRVSRS